MTDKRRESRGSIMIEVDSIVDQGHDGLTLTAAGVAVQDPTIEAWLLDTLSQGTAIHLCNKAQDRCKYSEQTVMHVDRRRVLYRDELESSWAKGQLAGGISGKTREPKLKGKSVVPSSLAPIGRKSLLEVPDKTAARGSVRNRVLSLPLFRSAGPTVLPGSSERSPA